MSIWALIAIGHGPSHYPWQQPGPDDTMTLDGNTGHLYLYDTSCDVAPQTPANPQALTKISGLCIGPSGYLDHRFKPIDPSCSWVIDPDMTSGSSST